jgi:hypothetical protein
MQLIHLATATALALALAACGSHPSDSSSVKEEWDGKNRPLRLSAGYVHKFSTLPVEGALPKTPWTDDYWPSYQGGIAKRWKMPDSDNFSYRAPSRGRLQRMSEADLARLSPAEKFDIFIGDYRYGTVETERNRVSPRNETWEGICHGWAPAAINFEEPKPVVLANQDGIKIPFGSSDVKALLSYYQGQIKRLPAPMLGDRCYDDIAANPARAIDPSCRDTNAGAFHIVLANQIGIRQQGFVADVTRDYMVWNQPVHAFTSRVLRTQAPSPGAAPGTVEEKLIETVMTYTVEVDPQWDALVGTPGHSDDAATYLYRVELDRNGEIIGGEWETEERPDFLWTQPRPQFEGRWSPLETIYRAAIAAQPYTDPTL